MIGSKLEQWVRVKMCVLVPYYVHYTEQNQITNDKP